MRIDDFHSHCIYIQMAQANIVSHSKNKPTLYWQANPDVEVLYI